MFNTNSVSYGREDYNVDYNLENGRAYGALYRNDNFIKNFDVQVKDGKFTVMGIRDEIGFVPRYMFYLGGQSNLNEDVLRYAIDIAKEAYHHDLEMAIRAAVSYYVDNMVTDDSWGD